MSERSHRAQALLLLEQAELSAVLTPELLALAQVHASLAVEQALREAMSMADSMIPAPFRRRRAG